MAKKTKSKARRKAWDAFSKYIRVRDCLQTTGTAFVCVCITCYHKIVLGEFLQAGHGIAGRSNAVLFDEEWTNGQCTICNELHHGRLKRYRKKLVERHGEKYVAKRERELKAAAKSGSVRYTESDYGDIEKKYKEKLEKLLREHGYKTYAELLTVARY